jgi:hypothetical protein
MKRANFGLSDQPLRAQPVRLVPLGRNETFRLREMGPDAGSPGVVRAEGAT